MKRIFLLVATNVAVLLVLSVTLRLLGVDRILDERGGLDINALLIFSAVLGFGGSLISLAMSKFIAKRMMGVRVIEQPRDAKETWLVETVRRQAASRRHRHAGSRHLRCARDERIRDRSAPEQRAGRRQLRLAARHVATRSRSGARPRDQSRRERRHGDADADPGRGEHVRHLPVARHRLRDRSRRVQDRARPRSGIPHHRDRRAARARHSREHDRDVVLAVSRVPCRRRRRQAGRPRADDRRAGTPASAASAAAARPDGCVRHQRRRSARD